MLQVAGCVILMIGSCGIGLSLKKKLKENLHALYRLREIVKLLQNEIIYNKAALPEACKRIAQRVEEPYYRTFMLMYQDALENRGESFRDIWKKRMGECLCQLPLLSEDKKNMMDFGDCIGHIDPVMQANVLEQVIHRLDLSIKVMEKDIVNKGKMIMSLSVMGGLLVAVILL